MNIPDDIVDYGEKHGLETCATGGGCDYMIRKLGFVTLVLSCPEGGESPDSLDDKACVSVQMDPEWITSVTFYYKTARKAIRAMAKVTDCNTCPTTTAS